MHGAGLGCRTRLKQAGVAAADTAALVTPALPSSTGPAEAVPMHDPSRQRRIIDSLRHAPRRIDTISQAQLDGGHAWAHMPQPGGDGPVLRGRTCLAREDAERVAGRIGKHVERLGILGAVEHDCRAESERPLLLTLELVA